MNYRFRRIAPYLALFFGSGAGFQVFSQIPTHQPTGIAVEKDELKFVVIISRHGLRSPTGNLDQLNQYSRQPWPVWTVPPGYLTEHGSRLMTLFGAYDRVLLAGQGLLATSGGADAES